MPRTARITEVNIDVGRQAKPSMSALALDGVALVKARTIAARGEVNRYSTRRRMAISVVME